MSSMSTQTTLINATPSTTTDPAVNPADTAEKSLRAFTIAMGSVLLHQLRVQDDTFCHDSYAKDLVAVERRLTLIASAHSQRRASVTVCRNVSNRTEGMRHGESNRDLMSGSRKTSAAHRAGGYSDWAPNHKWGRSVLHSTQNWPNM